MEWRPENERGNKNKIKNSDRERGLQKTKQKN